MRSGWNSALRAASSLGSLPSVRCSGAGVEPGIIQFRGTGRPERMYQAAASSCDSKRWTMRRSATRRQWGATSGAYLPFFVTYATRSPWARRGANIRPRQRAVIAGNSVSKSGSRRHDPSMNGFSWNRSIASLPWRVRHKGRYVARNMRGMAKGYRATAYRHCCRLATVMFSQFVTLSSVAVDIPTDAFPHGIRRSRPKPSRRSRSGLANGSIANLRGQGPRAEAVRRGSCRAYCWIATRDLQLP